MTIAANPPLRSSRIAFLDYLRIFAFVSVLIGHKFFAQVNTFIGNTNMHSTPRAVLNYLLPFFEGGGAGVVVFFLVSGYIITHVLQNENTLEFTIKRIFRIYPLYIVAVLLQIAIEGSLPELSILIPRMLLIGDFFNTPYALFGVEWTLRVEILFYAYMGILRAIGVLHAHKKWIPWIFTVTTLMLRLVSPFPPGGATFTGYTTIYGPFLFIGSAFFLREMSHINTRFMLFLIGLVLIQYYQLIEVFQTYWINAHFATLSLIIFTLAWHFRSRLIATPGVLLFSDLTFAVYLFHNWIWDPIKNFLAMLSVSILDPDIQALIILLLLCFLMSKLIEKPSIRVGRMVLRKLQSKRRPTA